MKDSTKAIIIGVIVAIPLILMFFLRFLGEECVEISQWIEKKVDILGVFLVEKLNYRP